jgi:Flp pilus assembly protein TadG
MRARPNFLRNTVGATAVEFALVCPLIFSAVLGTFETGRALFVRNQIAEAAAAGARAVIVSSNNATTIENAVKNRFSTAMRPNVIVNQTNVTIAGATFKKIEVVYDHDFIIKLGDGLSGITITLTRYAPRG